MKDPRDYILKRENLILCAERLDTALLQAAIDIYYSRPFLDRLVNRFHPERIKIYEKIVRRR